MSQAGVLLRIVNEPIGGSGIGKHLVVKGSQPPNDEFLLKIDRLICDSVRVERGWMRGGGDSHEGNETIDAPFGNDGRLGGGLFRRFDV